MDEAPLVMPPDDASSASRSDERFPVTFTGSGSEYFKIWIVNVSLTLLTLGIFSAWAKVRRLQYFHRHTHVAGASFDFHGEPIAILKGRIVGAVLFLSYTFGGAVNLFVALGAFLIIAAIMPWMLGRSFRFRLRNTSYRGLRFDFTGTTRSAYRVFLLLPIASLMSLGLLVPYCHHQIKRYQFDNASYGSQPFTTTVAPGPFYAAYIVAAVAGMLVAGVFVGLIEASVALDTAGGGEAGLAATISGVLLFSAGVAVYLVGLLAVQAFVTVQLRNALWNTLAAGRFAFTSALGTRRMVWILVTNLVVTIGTLGLFWPFAQVRLARFFTEGIAMNGLADFSAISAASITNESALGDEVAGFFDVDIAF